MPERPVTYHEWQCPKCGWRYHSDRGLREAWHTHKESATTARIVVLRPVTTPAPTLFDGGDAA